MVSSSAEIRCSASISLLIHSVTCNRALCLGCNAFHLLHADQALTVPRRLPPRQEQIVRWCREASSPAWVLRPRSSSPHQLMLAVTGYPANTPRRFPSHSCTTRVHSLHSKH